MQFRTATRAAIAGACFAGLALAAQAGSHSSGHPGVDARKAVMKDLGGSLNTVKAFVQGKRSDAGEVAAAAAAMAASAAEVQYVFGDQIHVANAGDVKTTATADIWSKWGEFKQIGDDLQAAAGQLAAAAASGNANAVKAAFGAAAKNCGACHKPFRQKKN